MIIIYSVRSGCAPFGLSVTTTFPLVGRGGAATDRPSSRPLIKEHAVREQKLFGFNPGV